MTVKKTDSSVSAVTIDGNGSETIDEAVIRVLTKQYDVETYRAGSSQWNVSAVSKSNDPAGLVLLVSATAANSATVEFTGIDATYDRYLLDWNGVRPANNDIEMLVRFSSDGGSSFGTTAYTEGVTNGVLAAGQTTVGDGLSNTAGQFGHGRLTLYEPIRNSQTYCQVTSTWFPDNSADQPKNRRSAHMRQVVEQVDALQVIMTTGNITEGVFRLYGVKK